MAYIRFKDLVARGILNNRVTLRRWQEECGFPVQIKLGLNTAVWLEEEVDAWLASRANLRKSALPKHDKAA